MNITTKEVILKIQNEFEGYDFTLSNTTITHTKVIIYQNGEVKAHFFISKINSEGLYCEKTISEQLRDIKFIFAKELRLR